MEAGAVRIWSKSGGWRNGLYLREGSKYGYFILIEVEGPKLYHQKLSFVKDNIRPLDMTLPDAIKSVEKRTTNKKKDKLIKQELKSLKKKL
jgi:hypothetical protein